MKPALFALMIWYLNQTKPIHSPLKGVLLGKLKYSELFGAEAVFFLQVCTMPTTMGACSLTGLHYTCVITITTSPYQSVLNNTLPLLIFKNTINYSFQPHLSTLLFVEECYNPAQTILRLTHILLIH